MRIASLFSCITLFLAVSGQAPSAATDAPQPDSTTARRFEETMAFARKHRLHEKAMGEIMTTLGMRFVDSPYVAGMLDEPAEETLICRLDGFDCVTFVESMLAMARAIKQEQYGYETWTGFLRDQRYRDGKMEGYCSRLHFFTEWIIDNQKRGTVKNITRDLGGVLLDKKIDFMTAHRESYPRISENDSLFACIQGMESNLQDAEIFYIPQDQIHEVYDQLQAGDIIATATHLKGLDVTHTGLVYDGGNGKKGLLHASASGSVRVSPDLQAYVQGVKVTIGIIVARPMKPRTS
jgi:cell wall-associated NlpC family hydrolase